MSISCGESNNEFNFQFAKSLQAKIDKNSSNQRASTYNYTYISCGESGNEFPDNFEFTTEEGVFVLLELVFVHAKEIKVDSGNGFDETFERGGELELPEKAGWNASGGGAGQTDLQILRSISNFTSLFQTVFRSYT